MTIADAMTPDPVAAASSDTIRAVASRMAEGGFGSLPVTDGQTLVGIITDRDIVVRAVAKGRDLGTPVADVMTPDPVCVDVGASLDEAAALMQERQIRRLYVTDGDALAGVVSLGDVALKAGDDLSGRTLEQISKA